MRKPERESVVSTFRHMVQTEAAVTTRRSLSEANFAAGDAVEHSGSQGVIVSTDGSRAVVAWDPDGEKTKVMVAGLKPGKRRTESRRRVSEAESADAQYKANLKKARGLLASIEKNLKAHEKEQKKRITDWSYTGDVGSLVDDLSNLSLDWVK